MGGAGFLHDPTFFRPCTKFMNITNHTSEQQKPISELIPNPRNPNQHDDKQIAMLAKIIEFQGWRLPIVVSKKSGFIVRGHGRLMAAQKLGLEQVPVSVQEYENEAQEWADLIADNRIAELAEIERSTLKDLLEELDTGDFNMDLTGFDNESLESLMSEFFVEGDGETDDDEVPDEAPERCSEGDLWMLGDHRLLCGDCTVAENVQKLTAGIHPEIMVTDPPYGVEYDPSWRADAGVNKNTKKMGVVANDERADWTDAWKLYNGDIAYVYHAGLFTGVVGESLIASGFDLRAQIIWAKDRFALSRGDYHWQHEPCWYAIRKGKRETAMKIARSQPCGRFRHGTMTDKDMVRKNLSNACLSQSATII